MRRGLRRGRAALVLAAAALVAGCSANAEFNPVGKSSADMTPTELAAFAAKAEYPATQYPATEYPATEYPATAPSTTYTPGLAGAQGTPEDGLGYPAQEPRL